MTVNRGLWVPINTGNVGTTEVEARLADAALFESNNGADPRSGLLAPASTTIVTGKANMSYDIAACNPVINRAATEGVYRFSATGVTNVATTAAPAANSRIDVIWLKQNDQSKTDANNLAVAGVTQGVVAASPVAPAIPAGALELARATVGPNITATTAASITQTFRYAALKGEPVPVRNVTERAEITVPRVGQQVIRLDLDPSGRAVETWTGAAWVAMQRPTKMVIPDASLVGNAVGLAAKVASGEVQLINLVMTIVATTDGAGYAGLNYPAGTFPSGVLTATFSNGDSAAGGRDAVLARSAIHTADTSRLVVSVVDINGAALVNRTMRFEINVWGW